MPQVHQISTAMSPELGFWTGWYQRAGGDVQKVRTSPVTEPAAALVVSTSIENTDLDPRHSKASPYLSRLYGEAGRFSGQEIASITLSCAWVALTSRSIHE